MDMEKLVEAYIDAWNRRDVDDILEPMHNGAALYDAFWMETCVGKDLPKYLQDSIDEENHWYQRIGEIIVSGSGVAYRYSAHERIDTTPGPVLYEGAEVINVLGGKIVTVSDFYCNPDRSALKEIIESAEMHHGLPSHTHSGLGALRMSRLKAELPMAIVQDGGYIDPNMTLSQLADKIGCAEDDLSQVISRKFGTDFHTFLGNQRVEYARSLLKEDSDDPDYLMRVASRAGFRFLEEFNDSFRKLCGMTPDEFFHRTNKSDDRPD